MESQTEGTDKLVIVYRVDDGPAEYRLLDLSAGQLPASVKRAVEALVRGKTGRVQLPEEIRYRCSKVVVDSRDIGMFQLQASWGEEHDRERCILQWLQKEQFSSYVPRGTGKLVNYDVVPIDPDGGAYRAVLDDLSAGAGQTPPGLTITGSRSQPIPEDFFRFDDLNGKGREAIFQTEGQLRAVVERPAWEGFMRAAQTEKEVERAWTLGGYVLAKPEESIVVVNRFDMLEATNDRYFVSTSPQAWSNHYNRVKNSLVGHAHLHPCQLEEKPLTATPSTADVSLYQRIERQTYGPCVFIIALFGATSGDGDVKAWGYLPGAASYAQITLEVIEKA